MFENGKLSLILTTVAATGVTLFILLFIKRNGTKDVRRRYPPSLPALPLLGAILRGGMSILPGYFMKSAEKLGPMFSCNVGVRLVVILSSKQAISEAFLRQSEAFADRIDMCTKRNILHPSIRGIIFARYNDAYKKNHKLCLSILKEFGFGVNSVSETRILQEVESLTEEILQLNGHQFDPKMLTVLSTFRVVSSILFGETFLSSGSWHKRIAEGVREYLKNLEFAFDFAPFLRFLPNFRRKIASLAQCHQDILNGVEEGIEYSKSNDRESTFVRRFIEIQGSDYDHQDLLHILRDLCFGSAGNAATTLMWALVELANHPEVLTRFQREIDDVIPEDRFPSLDDKPRLPYTDAVILEVMRRRTVIPLYLPHATLEDTEVLGYYIPKGCMVLANAFCAHMDPKSWIDPENFIPERFLDEGHAIIGSENVIPFGLGKRSCLGEILGRQEIFLFLTSLVQRFDIRPPEGQDSIRVKEIIGASISPSEYEVRMIPRRKIKN